MESRIKIKATVPEMREFFEKDSGVRYYEITDFRIGWKRSSGKEEKRLRKKWKKPENFSGFFCCLVSKIKFLSVVIVWRQSAA